MFTNSAYFDLFFQCIGRCFVALFKGDFAVLSIDFMFRFCLCLFVNLCRDTQVMTHVYQHGKNLLDFFIAKAEPLK